MPFAENVLESSATCPCRLPGVALKVAPLVYSLSRERPGRLRHGAAPFVNNRYAFSAQSLCLCVQKWCRLWGKNMQLSAILCTGKSK